jgi:hypothetical protein
MKRKRIIKETIPILNNSFYQLLIVYLVYNFAITFNLIRPLTKIDFFGIILGIMGCFIIFKEKKLDLKPKLVLPIAFILIIFTRIVWYFFTSVPLGYDPGWYKAVFDFGFSEEWFKSVFPMLFSFVGFVLAKFIGSSFLVKWGAVVLSILLGYVLYFVISKKFNQNIAIISVLLYTVSYAMYSTFWYNYIKNLLGMIFLLLAFHYFDSYKTWSKRRFIFILVCGAIGGIHRPATLIFGVVYSLYLLWEFYEKRDFLRFRNRVYDGVLILGLMFLFNFDRIPEFILGPMLGFGSTVVSGTAGGGTFFSLADYWKYSFSYIPFAIIGLWRYYKNKLFSLSLLFCTVIVVFELFFFNRFIIYLDFFILIFAACGFYVLISGNKRIGSIVFILFLGLSGYVMATNIYDNGPLITDDEFEYINNLKLEDDVILIVTASQYSTWLKGYYYGEIIAPGLFDNNPWNKDEWNFFWFNVDKRVEMLLDFKEKSNITNNSSIYIHQGDRQIKYNWNNACFIKQDNYVYKFVC